MTITSAAQSDPDPKATLYKALSNVAPKIGLSMAELAAAIGKDSAQLSQSQFVEPDTESGELGLMLIRCYCSLFALMGGDEANIRHFMLAENLHLRGVPAEMIKSATGLAELTRYLNAMVHKP